MPFEPPQKSTHTHDKPIEFYIDQMYQHQEFSIAGFSDAEFYCMMGIREGVNPLGVHSYIVIIAVLTPISLQ